MFIIGTAYRTVRDGFRRQQPLASVTRHFPPGGTSAPEITIADISPSPKLGSTQRDRTFSLLPQNPKSTRSCPNISVEIGMLERRRPARAIIFRPDTDSRRYQARRRRRETGPRLSVGSTGPAKRSNEILHSVRSLAARQRKKIRRPMSFAWTITTV